MNLWTPYLESLAGSDPQDAERWAEKLVWLLGALRHTATTPADRIFVLTQVLSLDATGQVFLLPELASAFSDPDPRVRALALQVAANVAREDTSRSLAALRRLCEAPSDAPAPLDAADVLSDVLVTSDFKEVLETAAPFSNLYALSEMVLTLSGLLGFAAADERRASQAAARSRREPTLLSRWASDDGEALRVELGRILRSKPMFARLLVVRWMIATRISPSANQSVDEALLEVYGTESNAMVAREALAGWARLLPRESAAEGARLLRREWETLAIHEDRPLEGDPRQAMIALTTGTIEAFGVLAAAMLPDTTAVDALGALLNQWATNRLGLIDSRLPLHVRKRVLCAALRIHGPNVLVRGRPVVIDQTLYFDAGLERPLRLDYRGRWPLEEARWARVVGPAMDLRAPLRGPFLLVDDPHEADQGTWDLSGPLAPTFRRWTPRIPDRFNSLELEEDAHVRGPWILAGWKAAISVLREALNQKIPLHEPPLARIVDHVRSIGAATRWLPKPQLPRDVDDVTREKANDRRRALRDAIVSGCINQLTDPAAFEALFPAGSTPPLACSLLVDVAQSAQRNLPSEVAYGWISGNLERLSAVSSDPNVRPDVRLKASMIRHIHAISIGDLMEPSDVGANEALRSLPSALALVPNLEVLPPKEAWKRQALDTEIGARALEATTEGAETDASVEAWAERRLEEDDLGVGHIRPLERRRMLIAFGRCRGRLAPNARRLRSWLLRVAGPAELALFLATRGERSLAEDGPLLAWLEQSEPPSSVRDRRDLRAVAEMGVWKRVVNDALLKEARTQGEAFTAGFIGVRVEQRLPPAGGRVAMFRAGRVEAGVDEVKARIEGTPPTRAGSCRPFFVDASKRRQLRGLLRFAARADRPSPGERVVATLHRACGEAELRPGWEARVDGHRWEVPRRGLTSDLFKLYALDELADDHEALALLARSGARVLIEDDQRARVVLDEAPWSMDELLMLVASGEVPEVCPVTRVGEDLLVELCPASLGDARPAHLSTVGESALLRPGDLFDPRGQPALFGRFTPGDRVALEVVRGEIQQDGTLAERDGALGCYLRCIDSLTPRASEVGHRLRTNTHVTIETIRLGTPSLELREPLLHEGVPAPRIVLEAVPRGAPEPTRNRIQGTVSEDWDPWAQDPVLKVRQQQEHTLLLGDRPAERVAELLDLRRGACLRGDLRFIPLQQGAVAALVDGLWVQLDPLLPHLLPVPLSAGALLHAGIRELRVTREWGNRKSIEWTDGWPRSSGPSPLRGLVVGVPTKSAPRHAEGRVAWLVEREQGAATWIIEELPFRPDGGCHPGDEIRIHSGDRHEYVLRSRTATPLARARELEEWARGQGDWSGEAVVISRQLPTPRGATSTERRWLLCLKVATLLSVPETSLVSEDGLGEIRPLDRLRLRLTRPGDRRPRLQIQSWSPSPLRAAASKKAWFRARKGGPDDPITGEILVEGHAPLPVRLGNLPPGYRALGEFRSATNPLRDPPEIACSVPVIDIEVEPTGDPAEGGFMFHISAWLAPPHAEHPVADTQILLEDVLAHGRGRVEATGTVLASNGSLGVRLDRYVHHKLVPLPFEERGWNYATCDEVRDGWSGRFAIVVEDGRTFASLRRLAPEPLGAWLYTELGRSLKLGQAMSVPLRFKGAPTEREWRWLRPLLSEWSDTFEPILFERGPGEALVASHSQLRILGHPFRPGGVLQTGDTLLSWELFRDDPRADLGGHLGIDVLELRLDLARSIEHFHERHGIFHGRLRQHARGWTVSELRGLDGQDRAIPEGNRDGWKFRVQTLSQEMARRMSDQGTRNELVYFAFVGRDEESREITFRVLGGDEVFLRDQLVFVRGVAVEPHGARDLRLRVEPISSLYEDIGPICYIPESLYSYRRHRMAAVSRAPEAVHGVFLARVDKVPGTDGPDVRLALIDLPPRPFRHLLQQPCWQGVVGTRSEGSAFQLEITPGVHVRVPQRQLAGPEQPLIRGDVLWLELDRARGRARITDRIPSQVVLLLGGDVRTVLALAWGSKRRQRENYEEGRPQNFDILGFSQLLGVGFPTPDTIGADAPQPFRAVRQDASGWVRLEAGTAPDEVCGWLRQVDGRPAVADLLSGREHPLHWRDLSVREAHAEDLERLVGELRWRERPSHFATEPTASVRSMPVIGRRSGGRVSLVAMASRPLPVDHLLEQLAPMRPGEPATASFVVADTREVVEGSREVQIVIEVGPGRYVGLPSALVRPPAKADLRPGLRMWMEQLRRGDEVVLERTRSGPGEELLPALRLLRGRPGRGRQILKPARVRLVRDAQSRPVLGPGRCALPAPDEEGLLKEREDGVVLVHAGGVAMDDGDPKAGDTVVLYRPTGGAPVVNGFEVPNLKMQWARTPSDPLQLDSERGAATLEALLAREDDVLWVTVERFDREDGYVLLSRRRQVEAALPPRGTVALAWVRQLIGQDRLLLELMGTPMLLPLERWCIGLLDSGALGDNPLARLTSREILVTRNSAGLLDATAVYALPETGEVEAVIRLVGPGGLVVEAHGTLLFVPVAELAWCPLTPKALQQLFAPGDSLTVALPTGKRPWASRIETRGIRREVHAILNTDLPVFLERTGIVEEDGSVLLRGRSGLLLSLCVDDGPPGRYVRVWVTDVDEDTRRVTLSLDMPASKKWNLRAVSPERALGSFDPQVFELRLSRLDASDPGAFDFWLAHQVDIEASPRNLRLLLDRVLDVHPGGAPWDRLAKSPARSGDLAAAWGEVAAAMAGQVLDTAMGPLARFGRGYLYLREGRHAEARDDLVAAAEAMPQDLEPALGAVLALSGEGRLDTASGRLDQLVRRLCASAMHTLGPPSLLMLPERIADDRGVFRSHIAEGRSLLEFLAARERRARRSPWHLVLAIWDALLTEGTRRVQEGVLDSGFTDFIAMIREEETYGSPTDPVLLETAAWLYFAHGDLERGWSWLLRASASESPGAMQITRTARAWTRWAESDGSLASTGENSLLQVLLEAGDELCSVGRCRPETFEGLLHAWTRSSELWLLDVPPIRLTEDDAAPR